jgi:hypothetical protein
VYINFTQCSASGSGAALHHPAITNSGRGILNYAIIVQCTGESIWFYNRSSSIEFAYCGFYSNSATYLIDLNAQVLCAITSCRFATDGTILRPTYASQVTFKDCWFSGDAPSSATTSNCRTQATTESYAFTGVDTYYCPREGSGPESSPPGPGPATRSEAFTDPLEMVPVRFIAMGLFIVPLEMLW